MLKAHLKTKISKIDFNFDFFKSTPFSYRKDSFFIEALIY